MKRNKQLLVLTHLSQLLDFVTGIGGFIVPLIIWAVKKDEILHMDEQGKAILNFRKKFRINFYKKVSNKPAKKPTDKPAMTQESGLHHEG